MLVEVTVIVKDAERTLKQKFLAYEPVTINAHDPLIKQYLEETLKNFGGEPEDIVVKTMMVCK